jgi:hypothetical protein
MKFRIVRDKYLGFEVRHKYRWFPFWFQTGGINTHATIERAEEFAKRKASYVVKDLGNISQQSQT